MDLGAPCFEASAEKAADGKRLAARTPLTGSPLIEQVGPLRQALARYFRSRVPDPSEVDDLVQDVFLRIVARDSSQPVEHLTGFVFSIAANVLADRGRRRFARKSDAHVAFDTDRHGDVDFDPHQILSGKNELEATLRALLALPPQTRRIFILHRLEGRKSRDVATQLGISVSAVEKHMVRAIQHLSASRKERG